MRMIRGILTGCMAFVLLVGCGASGPEDFPTPSPVASSTPTPTNTVAAAEPCIWSLEVTEAAVDTPDTHATNEAPNLDSPPNHVDNSRWKQRRALNAAQISAGSAMAKDVRAALLPLCDKGDFSPDRARAAIDRLDAESVHVQQVTSAYGDATVGLTFAVDLVNGACVFGDSRPGVVRGWVDGATGEGTCYEPVTH